MRHHHQSANQSKSLATLLQRHKLKLLGFFLVCIVLFNIISMSAFKNGRRGGGNGGRFVIRPTSATHSKDGSEEGTTGQMKTGSPAPFKHEVIGNENQQPASGTTRGCHNEYRDVVATGISHRWLSKSNKTAPYINAYLCESTNDFCDLDIEGGLLDKNYIESFEDLVRSRNSQKERARDMVLQLEPSADGTHMKVFLDINSHGGWHALDASRRGYDVVAMEPLPGPRAFLAYNLCQNEQFRGGVHVLKHYTLGHRNYTCCLDDDVADTCYSSMSISRDALLYREPILTTHAPEIESKLSEDDKAKRAECKDARGEFVKYRVLDDIHLPSLALVKIDAGYKTLQTLKGAETTLSRRYDQKFRVWNLGIVLVRVPLQLVEDTVYYLWNQGYLVYGTNFGQDEISSVYQLQRQFMITPPLTDQQREQPNYNKLFSAPYRHIYAWKRDNSDSVAHLNGLIESSDATARRLAKHHKSFRSFSKKHQ